MRCVCLLLLAVGCLICCIFCLLGLRSVVVERDCFCLVCVWYFGMLLLYIVGCDFIWVGSVGYDVWFLFMVFGFLVRLLFVCLLAICGYLILLVFALANWLCLFCNFVNSVAGCIVSVIVVWICLFAILFSVFVCDCALLRYAFVLLVLFDCLFVCFLILLTWLFIYCLGCLVEFCLRCCNCFVVCILNYIICLRWLWLLIG